MKLLLLALVVLSPSTICAQPWSQEYLLQSVRESHVEGNVPDAKMFRVLFVRDAGTFLSKRLGKKVTAEYELLREGATQTGIAFPKFYAWVRAVGEDKRVLVEGAMRVAAVERKEFHVADFLTREEIVAASARVEETFPRALVTKIREMAARK